MSLMSATCQMFNDETGGALSITGVLRFPLGSWGLSPLWLGT